MSSEAQLFKRFIDTFQAAIRLEIAAIQRQSGDFEIVLGDGEALGSDTRRNLYSYRFHVAQGRERLVDGISCLLRTDGAEHPVTIGAVQADNVTLHAGVRLRAATEAHGKRAVLIIHSWFLYERLLSALGTLKPETHQIQHALRLFGRLPVSQTTRALDTSYPQLNDSQLAAVQRSKNSELTFVWGPPGTGKTLTLACIVCELAREGKRILLTSTTNAALGQALARMASLPVLERMIAEGSVVRLGRTEAETFVAGLGEISVRLRASRSDHRERLTKRRSNVSENVAVLAALVRRLDEVERVRQRDLFARTVPRVLSMLDLLGATDERVARRLIAGGAKIQSNWLRRRLARFELLKQLYDRRLARQEPVSQQEQSTVVSRARVVLTTLTGAYFSPFLQDQRFDVVIAEEASMAVLPNLFFAACFATAQVIVVGDPRQLPPIVQSVESAVHRAMGRTIFEVTVPDPVQSEFVAMLDTQYRMHPAIGTLVSELFYESKLKHRGDFEAIDRITRAQPYPGDALVVIDTDGTTSCQSRKGSFSRVNPSTARLSRRACSPSHTRGGGFSGGDHSLRRSGQRDSRALAA